MSSSKVVREFGKIEDISDSIITIGKFNGVHIGHQKLINYVVEKAKCENKTSVVLLVNLYKKSIYNLDYNIDILKKLDVNYIVVIDFSTEFYKISSTNFFYSIKDYYNISEIAVGEDFAFGHNREGNISDLKALCQDRGVGINVFPFCYYDNEKISSSSIIEQIELGNAEQASTMLGREYSYTSVVEHGKHLGHTIGFATANFIPSEQLVLPKEGVYFSKTSVDGGATWLMSMTFIGRTPLVKERRFETHIFDYEENLYDREIEVRLYHYHRANVKVGSLEELKSTLENDKISTYKYFNK